MRTDEALADFENRLAFLEALYTPSSRGETKEERLEVIEQQLTELQKSLPKNERGEVQQLKAQLLHIHNEVHELKQKSKGKPSPKNILLLNK